MIDPEDWYDPTEHVARLKAQVAELKAALTAVRNLTFDAAAKEYIDGVLLPTESETK